MMNRRQVGLKYGFKSGLEEGVMKDLKERGVEFTYEPFKIPFVQPEKKREYTPDFKLEGADFLIETKGRLVKEDRFKHLWIKEQHPDIEIRFLFQNPNGKIIKGSKTTYSMWAEKNGFKWCGGKTIPQEWIDEARNKDESK